MSTKGFATRVIRTWADFVSLITSFDKKWLYRGQSTDDDLTSTLERTLNAWKIDLRSAPDIEHQIIREFRRRLTDPLYHRIHSDTLHCVALMRHHGAPARIIDCTYSPFVAAKFALEKGSRTSVIYCVNADWCHKTVVRMMGKVAEERGIDKKRTDATFLQMYLSKRRRRFVHGENPFHLNERLTIQQGVFLCPGDIASTFVENIQAMSGWDSESNIVKLHLQLDAAQLKNLVSALKKMNLSSASLFPGLDGVARSLGEDILHFEDMARRKVGRR